VGVFLSGGSIVVVAARLPALRRPAYVRTFTIGLDEPRFDESVHAKKGGRALAPTTRAES